MLRHSIRVTAAVRVGARQAPRLRGAPVVCMSSSSSAPSATTASGSGAGAGASSRGSGGFPWKSAAWYTLGVCVGGYLGWDGTIKRMIDDATGRGRKSGNDGDGGGNGNGGNGAATGGGIDVVLGAQWGDEGKGKLVDILSADYRLCVRAAGGSNAGHTIVDATGKKYKFHLIPSGMLHEDTTCVIGNGVVLHVPSLLREIESLEAAGVQGVDNRLRISDRTHLVFDFHQEVDGMSESRLGRNKIGTTKKGIGPAYASKMSRQGLRVGDLRDMEYFERRLRALARTMETSFPGLRVNIKKELAYYTSVRDRILHMTTDTIELLNSELSGNESAPPKDVLVEGANAMMLDIDFGTYPYVTSSSPSIGGVCTLGVAPTKFRRVWGTAKAYLTRVGEGPFPTELTDDTGERLRKVGGEFGTTTGRARRCGWLDIPQLRYSTKVNGYSQLNLTKLDVLTGMPVIKLGVGYKVNGQSIDYMPSSLSELDSVEVEYEELPGWSEDISGARDFRDLPLNARRYVNRIEELVGVPIRWIGVGPGRLDMIDRHNTEADRY